MTAPIDTCAPAALRTADEDVTQAITVFTDVLEQLQDSHRLLEARALHMEAELCRTNGELEAKVEELDRVKRHLEAVLTAIPTGVVVYDAAGRVIRANDAATEILGTDRTDLADAAAMAAVAGDVTDGSPTEVTCGDGAVRVLARRRSTIRLAGDEGSGEVEVIEDQTELVRAQERLHRLDKTAALGTMAGGIAHEIRNPLHAIQGFAELLCREPSIDAGSKAFRHARRIREGVSEIEGIVASMLGIAGQGELALETFELGGMLEDAVDAARRGREDASRWTVELDVEAGRITADRIKLRQAVRNLVANACDAQPGGGRVLVRAHETAAGVRLAVADDGPGIGAADAHRLCDPFFTTRAEGTGLGLALVQRVAELHGGSLELEPSVEPLQGACFALLVPGVGTADDADRREATVPTAH